MAADPHAARAARRCARDAATYGRTAYGTCAPLIRERAYGHCSRYAPAWVASTGVAATQYHLFLSLVWKNQSAIVLAGAATDA